MRRRTTSQDSVGEDSFLDTTANLVGILIILVVVIGTKTRLEAEEYTKSLVEQEESEEIESSKQTVAALREELIKQDLMIKQHAMESEYRKMERDAMLAKLASAKQAVDEKLNETDTETREAVERSSEIDRLKAELSDLADRAMSNEEQPRPTVVLEHLPTPMARTVYDKEMHVQLKANKVTTIPWERLVEMLKRQVPLTARRQASRQKIEDTLGPVSGFVMHYAIAPVPGGFELDHFTLEVLPSAAQESIPESMAPTGRLALELASRDPKETVITVWVYPDSFESFRDLKARLFEAGFLSAARPLPHGQPIAASPQGTRSSAQ